VTGDLVGMSGRTVAREVGRARTGDEILLADLLVDEARIAPDTSPPRRPPATIPSGTPTSVATRSAVAARIAVFAARSGMRSATGRSYASDRPKSKRAGRCAIDGAWWA